MVPRKPKPKPEPEEDDDDDRHSITVDGKNLKVSFDTGGKGIVLVYAIAFAIVLGMIGFVAFQIITALKITVGSIREAIGFIACLLITFICAWLSR